MNVDYQLLSRLVEYKKMKRYFFKNYIPNPCEDKELERILNARYNKFSRLKKRVYYLLYRFSFIYFVTFTFDDDHLALCERSQRDLIKNSLYSFDKNIKFILNVDYGKKNERLHYHAIVATNSPLDLSFFLKLTYPCFTYCEKIRFNVLDISRVSKYLNKLSNHAIKDSTKNRRIYYNFKGYDNNIFKSWGFNPTLLYRFEKAKIDTLLDKGVVTGKEIPYFLSNFTVKHK